MRKCIGFKRSGCWRNMSALDDCTTIFLIRQFPKTACNKIRLIVLTKGTNISLSTISRCLYSTDYFDTVTVKNIRFDKYNIFNILNFLFWKRVATLYNSLFLNATFVSTLDSQVILLLSLLFESWILFQKVGNRI